MLRPMDIGLLYERAALTKLLLRWDFYFARINCQYLTDKSNGAYLSMQGEVPKESMQHMTVREVG